MIPNQTPPSTPERHRTARRHDQRPQEMPTPQHRRVPAQPSDDENPFLVDGPVAGGTWQLPPVSVRPPDEDPFLVDAPVQASVNPPVLTLEQIRAQADFHAENLHVQLQATANPPVLTLEQIRARADLYAENLHVQVRGRASRRGRPGRRGQGSINLNPTRPLSLPEIHSIHSQIPTPPPPANRVANNQLAGLSYEQLLLARHSLPSSGATTPAASSSPSSSHASSPVPS
jgi:hypothetical protein